MVSGRECFTERQAAAWPEAIQRARKCGADVTEGGYYWTFDLAEEVRPGRGHFVDATWLDGEHFVQIRMDVYGGPSVSVAALDWIHSDSSEECECDLCVAERAEDGAP